VSRRSGSALRRRLPRRERDWRVLDRVLALVLVAAVVLELGLKPDLHGPRALNVALYAAAALVLLVRREWPLAPIVAVALAGTLGQAVLTGPPELGSVIVVLATGAYSVGAHGRQRVALIGLGVGIGVVAAVSIMRDESDVIFPVVFFVFLPWLIGRTLRHQGALSRELAEKAERAEHAREEEERSAVLAERARIARELHDVLAHNLSVMVVQASAARRVVERDAAAAAGAAELVRATGREALDELRALLGPMHREEGEPLQGVPSLQGVDRLVRRAGQAGLSVSLKTEGEPVHLPTGVDLAAYRVAQEALTNTLKHAGRGARARVVVRYRSHEVTVDVEDDGPGSELGSGLADVGGGHGLVGMRERVEVYGGGLDAGPLPDGGYRVVARLPVARGKVAA
jgi:signal transduction histidine kinase